VRGGWASGQGADGVVRYDLKMSAVEEMHQLSVSFKPQQDDSKKSNGSEVIVARQGLNGGMEKRGEWDSTG